MLEDYEGDKDNPIAETIFDILKTVLIIAGIIIGTIVVTKLNVTTPEENKPVLKMVNVVDMYKKDNVYYMVTSDRSTGNEYTVKINKSDFIKYRVGDSVSIQIINNKPYFHGG